jgi:hypothetical protein
MSSLNNENDNNNIVGRASNFHQFQLSNQLSNQGSASRGGPDGTPDLPLNITPDITPDLTPDLTPGGNTDINTDVNTGLTPGGNTEMANFNTDQNLPRYMEYPLSPQFTPSPNIPVRAATCMKYTAGTTPIRAHLSLGLSDGQIHNFPTSTSLGGANKHLPIRKEQLAIQNSDLS